MATSERRRSSKRRTPIFSANRYRENRAEVPLSSLRAQETARKHRTHRLRAFITIALLSVGLYGIWWVTNISNITVAVQAASSAVVASAEPQYAQAIEDYLDSTFLAKNSLFLDEEQLAQNLQARFPEIAKISLKSSFLKRNLSVTVTQRQPIGVITVANQAYLVDGSGVAFYQLPAGTDPAGLPVIVDDTGLAATLGERIITSEIAEYIAKLQVEFRPTDIQVARFIVPKELRELQVQFNGENFVYKLHTDIAPEQSFAAIMDIREWLIANKTTPSAYVDLRVPNKAAYH